MVARGTSKKIGSFTFNDYGAHLDNYPHHYLTVAAAIGITQTEIDVFLVRLAETLRSARKKIPHAG